MPYLSDKIKISGGVYDKRIKYTPEQIEEVKILYHKENYSMRKISRETGISRRYIDFILNPEHRIDNMKKRDWTKYYDRKNLTKLVRELRRRKQKLFLEGKILLVDNKIKM